MQAGIKNIWCRDPRSIRFPIDRNWPPATGRPVRDHVVKMLQEIPIGVQSACPRKFSDKFLSFDHMHEHELAAAHPALLDELVIGCDHPHLTNERGIEADLLHAIHDCRRGGRNPRALSRSDVDDQDVSRIAIINQRIDRGIARITTVPIIFAVNLDGLHQKWQAG